MRLLASTLTLSLLAALVACGDDASPAPPDADPAPEAADPPCPRTSDAPYVRSSDTFTGALYTWPREVVLGCIPLTLDTDGAQLGPETTADAVWRAAQTWEDAADACDAPLCFRPGDSPPPPDALGYNPDGENANLVRWVNDADTWNATYVPHAIAVTTTTYGKRSGLILDADIEVNQARYAFSDVLPPDYDVWDLESVFLHELGHLLGFDHSPDPDAAMLAHLPLEDTARRHLSPSDIAGVCETFACY